MSEQDHALRLLQALADPTRLRLVAALLEQPACCEDLAERLGLTPPTITHHLGKLDQAGLINRRREQYYTVCEARPGPLQKSLRELVDATADTGGAEQARLDLARRRVLEAFFERGRLLRLPAQRKKRLVVLAALAADFEPDRDYAEAEVNAIVTARYADYCTVRRELVDERLLERDGLPPRYRRTGTLDTRPLPRPATLAAIATGGAIAGKEREEAMDTRDQAGRPDVRRRKEWIELYKQARKAAGVYGVRNLETGRLLLGSSVNLHGPLNRHRSELRNGSHRCADLQADWNRLGEDAFSFEILDRVPDGVDGLERDEALKQLEQKWLAACAPGSEACYNSSPKIRVRQF